MDIRRRTNRTVSTTMWFAQRAGLFFFHTDIPCRCWPPSSSKADICCCTLALGLRVRWRLTLLRMTIIFTCYIFCAATKSKGHFLCVLQVKFHGKADIQALSFVLPTFLFIWTRSGSDSTWHRRHGLLHDRGTWKIRHLFPQKPST